MVALFCLPVPVSSLAWIMNLNRLLVAEFFGSLFLCLSACLGHSDFSAAAVFVVLFYTLGGHFNPLVTVAAYLGGQTTLPESGRRLAAQGLGALAASLVGLIWYSSSPRAMLAASLFPKILAGELLGGFLLGVVYLRSSQKAVDSDRNLSGVLVGLAMFAGVSIFPNSILNPASVITGVLLGSFPWWTVLTGTIGSVVGVFGATYFVHWWNQPASPAPSPSSMAPETTVSPEPVAPSEPNVEKLPSKKR
jgi:glycerol uptake facilitator-like aquaporin